MSEWRMINISPFAYIDLIVEPRLLRLFLLE